MSEIKQLFNICRFLWVYCFCDRLLGSVLLVFWFFLIASTKFVTPVESSCSLKWDWLTFQNEIWIQRINNYCTKIIISTFFYGNFSLIYICLYFQHICPIIVTVLVLVTSHTCREQGTWSQGSQCLFILPWMMYQILWDSEMIYFFLQMSRTGMV